MQEFRGGDARSAPRRHHDCSRRLRPLRHSGEPDPGAGRQRRQGIDDRRQQRRRRRFRHGPAAQVPAGEESDRIVRRREQGVRAPGARGRARAQTDAARDARGEIARGRRRHSGLLHAHGSRHAARRRQGNALVRRQGVRARGGHPRRRVDRQGMEGRHRRQPGLPRDVAQFQSDDRDLRRCNRRGSGTAGGCRRARPGLHSHAGHLRRSHRPGRTIREAHRIPHRGRTRPRKRIRRCAR